MSLNSPPDAIEITTDRGNRHLEFLTSSFVAVLLISNVAALKVFQLGGLVFDGGALIFPISYIFGDIFTEVYGYQVCRRIIWTGFLWLAVYNAVLALCNWLPPEPSWDQSISQAAFSKVFSLSPRLVLAGIAGFFWGEFANSYVLARLKVYTQGKHLWLRTIGSTLVGEFIDTGLFCLIAFGGVLEQSALLRYILVGYLYKTAVEIAMTPVTYWVINHLKKREGIEVYDTDTNFNPFRV